MLTDLQSERYQRQMQVEGFGRAAQEKLATSTFLLIGAGGLGCPCAQALAASGAGRLILVDADVVERSNLSRQFLHAEERIGMNKAQSAAVALRQMNPYLEVEVFAGYADEKSLPALVQAADVVVDCCDNSRTRHAVNRACLAAGKPLVTGACLRGSGQVAVFDFRTEGSPCYACAFPEDEERDLKASEHGVLTAATALVGAAQAAEAIKVATCVGKTLAGRLMLLGVLEGEAQCFNLCADPECPVCSGRK
jgi:adenylyltransferase/sulfurtransferase